MRSFFCLFCCGFNCYFNFFIVSLISWGVVVIFWSLNFYTIVSYIIVCGGVVCFFLLAKAWADNEKFLEPKWRRHIVYLVIAALVADIVMMICIPLISGLLKQPLHVDLLPAHRFSVDGELRVHGHVRP